MAPLGIQVMVVEPGAFRTDFSGRSLRQAEKAIADYAETAGRRRIEHDHSHGTQPGDPDQGARLVLESSGAQPPLPFGAGGGRLGSVHPDHPGPHRRYGTLGGEEPADGLPTRRPLTALERSPIR